MKKKILLLILAVNATSCVLSQEKTELKLIRTEPNGIQIYESLGNEIVIANSNELTINQTRSLEDWNLEECENALYYIGLKIEKMKENEGNEHLILEYEAQIVLINERINSLNSKK